MVKHKTLTGTYVVRRDMWGKPIEVKKVQEPVIQHPHYNRDLNKDTLRDY